MIPKVLVFIPGSLEGTDKYIKVADGHHVTENQKGQVEIKMCENNGDNFIATKHNVFLAPDICDREFSTNMLMSSGSTCLCHKDFCKVFLGGK